MASLLAMPPIAAAEAEQPLTLEQIMADPDWIGPPIKDAYWSADGRAVYYSVKRSGSPIVDLHRVVPGTGKDQTLGPRNCPTPMALRFTTAPAGARRSRATATSSSAKSRAAG